MLKLTSPHGKNVRVTLSISLRTLGIIILSTVLSVGCTSSAKHVQPLRVEDRAYEISLKNDGFYWSACIKKSIFGNCKKRMEDKIKCSDTARLKEFKAMGFKLMKGKDL